MMQIKLFYEAQHKLFLKLFAVRSRWIDPSYFDTQTVSFTWMWGNVQSDVRLCDVSRLNDDICSITRSAAVCDLNARYLLLSLTSDAVVRQNGGHLSIAVPWRASGDDVPQEELVAVSTGAPLEYDARLDLSTVPTWGSMQSVQAAQRSENGDTQQCFGCHDDASEPM